MISDANSKIQDRKTCMISSTNTKILMDIQ